MYIHIIYAYNKFQLPSSSHTLPFLSFSRKFKLFLNFIETDSTLIIVISIVNETAYK